MTRFAPVSMTASAALLLTFIVSGHARARECASSSDCEKGFECQDVGGADCTAPACAPGQSCPEPEPCAVVVQMACVPAPCTSDAQCGDGMVCHEYTSGCATSDCACSSDQPDCKCDVPACAPETVSYCTPRYALPCTAAADCGAGFTCEQLASCGCSGSTGTAGSAEPTPGAAPFPPDSGDAAPPAGDPLPPDCYCEPSGQSLCIPQEIECASDDACPSGWTCQQEPAVATRPACAGEDCAAAPAPEPLPTRSLCFPKYYGGVGGVAEDLGGVPTSGGDDQSNGSATPQPEAAGSDAAADGEESAACQIGHAPASRSVFGIVALLGALFGFARRRAQVRG